MTGRRRNWLQRLHCSADAVYGAHGLHFFAPQLCLVLRGNVT